VIDLREIQTKVFVILLIVICFLLFFHKVGDRDLWAPDEDEYGQMSREMIRTNNWLFPTVNGEPWAIKPALYNWCVSAISLPYGDVNEFRARVFSSLAALGTVLTIFQLGRIAFNPLAGFLGAIVLATNLLFIQYGRWAQTNMMSTFFATLAIFLFYRGYVDTEKRTSSYLLMYAAVGLGVLTMGPVNLAIPGLAVFFYLVVNKDVKHIFKMKLQWGIPLFLLIALPWYTLVGLQDGYGFDILIKTNLTRYFDTGAGHIRPFYYYIKDLPWAFFPWSLFLPGAFILAYSKRSKEQRKTLNFLLVWIVTIFIFFSLSKGKRPQYILSIYPALALLVGFLGDKAILLWKERFYQKAIIIPSIVLLSILAILVLALPIAAGIYFKPDFTSAPEFWLTIGVSVITVIFIALNFSAWKREKVQRLLLLPALYIIVFTLYSVHFIIPRMEVYKSPRPFCEEIRTRLDQGAEWAMYQYYRAAFVYYTDSLVDVIETKEDLVRFLDRTTRSLVAMREEEYDGLSEDIRNRMYMIYQRQIGHRSMVLVSNQPD